VGFANLPIGKIFFACGALAYHKVLYDHDGDKPASGIRGLLSRREKNI
jgi:hypothetical protein